MKYCIFCLQIWLTRPVLQKICFWKPNKFNPQRHLTSRAGIEKLLMCGEESHMDVPLIQKLITVLYWSVLLINSAFNSYWSEKCVLFLPCYMHPMLCREGRATESRTSPVIICLSPAQPSPAQPSKTHWAGLG